MYWWKTGCCTSNLNPRIICKGLQFSFARAVVVTRDAIRASSKSSSFQQTEIHEKGLANGLGVNI